jgi:hypothetical protein
LFKSNTTGLKFVVLLFSTRRFLLHSLDFLLLLGQAKSKKDVFSTLNDGADQHLVSNPEALLRNINVQI